MIVDGHVGAVDSEEDVNVVVVVGGVAVVAVIDVAVVAECSLAVAMLAGFFARPSTEAAPVAAFALCRKAFPNASGVAIDQPLVYSLGHRQSCAACSQARPTTTAVVNQRSCVGSFLMSI